MVSLGKFLSTGSRVKLVDQVISKTVNKNTGTVVERAMNTSENRLVAGGDHFCDDSLGITRLISYGKDTPLFKAGIHQAQITHLKNGSSMYRYFRDGKELYNIDWHIKNGQYTGSSFETQILKTDWNPYTTDIKERLRESLGTLLNCLKQIGK